MPEGDGAAADTARGRDALSLLLEVTVLLGADMSHDLRSRGLTEARATVLWTLGRRGPVTQRTLADELRVTPRNVTGLVDGLIAAGLVTRERHPADGRAFLVTPTLRGREQLAELSAAYDDLSATLFSDLDPSHLGDLVRGLTEVVARLRGAL